MRRRTFVTRSVVALALAAAIPAMAWAATALDYLQHFTRSASHDDFTVEEGRPLRQAATILAYEYGFRVSYEDAPLEYAGDLVDVTEKVRLPTAPLSSLRVIVPRTGQPLRASISKDPVTDRPSTALKAATEVLAAYDGASATTKYVLQSSGDSVHFVPSQIRDASGNWKRVMPLMGQAVNLPGGQISVRAAVNEIVRQLQLATSDPIKGVVLVPGDWMPIIPAYADRPAREVMSELVANTVPAMRWELIHDPAQKNYFLFVSAATKPGQLSDFNPIDYKYVPMPRVAPGSPTPSGRPMGAP